MHHHHHEPANYNRMFAVCMLLNTGYFVLQVVVALYVADSIALLTDAIHNMSDVGVLGAAWAANALLARHPTSRRTFGFKGVSISISLINSVVLLVVTGMAGWESIVRLWNPGDVSGSAMSWTAGAGIAINLASAFMLHGGGRHDLNIRTAFVHQAIDVVQSIGVVGAGVLIAWQDWRIVDPITGIVISAVIVYMTWGVLRDSALLSIQAVPTGVDTQAIVRYLESIPGVVEVHDLHIVGVSTAETAMTAHLVLDSSEHSQDEMLEEIQHTLSETYSIHRTTLQLERHDHDAPCRHTGHLYGAVEAMGECRHDHLSPAH